METHFFLEHFIYIFFYIKSHCNTNKKSNKGIIIRINLVFLFVFFSNKIICHIEMSHLREEGTTKS